MKKRKTVNIPDSILDDERISDSEFRLFIKFSLIFGTDKVKINDSVLNRLNVKKSTFYRLVKNLLERQYLQRNPSDGSYEIAVSKTRQISLNIEKIQSQNWDSEREEERTKEEDKENYNIDYIYNNTIRVKDNEKEREIQEREKAEPEADDKPKPKRAVFVKPTREEVLAYCRERQSTVSSSAFYDFYESKGWMVGKNHMKDWKAAVRTWEQKDKQSGRYYVPAENRTDGSDDLPY